MCDDFTHKAESRALAMSRRGFAVMGTATALAGCAGGRATQDDPLVERTVTVRTADGMTDAWFVHQEKGKHPGVILWPDIAGPREAMRLIARRLAGEGYAVLVVNQYYRSAPAPILATLAEWRTPEGSAKLKPMIAMLSPDGTMRDAVAFVRFLDADPAVDTKRGIGTVGFCMGGPFALRTATAAPDRVRAVASFHGAGLATGQPDSPHLGIARSRAAYLIAPGRNDDARDPGEKDRLRAAADAAGRPAEIEVYNADHGWMAPDSAVYDQAEADRGFARLLALYARL